MTTPIPLGSELRSHIEGLVRPIDSEAYVHPVFARARQPKLSARLTRLLFRAGIIDCPWKKCDKTGAKRRTSREYSFHSFRHMAVSDLKVAGISQATVIAGISRQRSTSRHENWTGK